MKDLERGSIIGRMARLVPFMLKVVTAIFFLIAYGLGQGRGGGAPGYAFEISDILGRAQLSGSLEYWGVCNWHEFVPDLPTMKSAPHDQALPLDKIRSMFAADSMMRVFEDRDGKVRMVEADAPDDLLRIKIHHLVFPVDHFGPYSAVSAILRTPEVLNFRIEHNIGPEVDWRGGFNYSGPLFKPTAMGELNDTTVAEALDYVEQTYPGFWLYENCKDADGARIVYFSFYINAPPSFYASEDQANTNRKH